MRLTDAEVRAVVGAWHGRHVGAKPRLRDVFGNPRGVVAPMRASRLAKSRAVS